jgi:hypothetical protein
LDKTVKMYVDMFDVDSLARPTAVVASPALNPLIAVHWGADAPAVNTQPLVPNANIAVVFAAD